MGNLGRRGSVNGDEEWQLRLKEAKGSAVPRVKMAAEISLSSHPGCVLVRGAMNDLSPEIPPLAGTMEAE